MPTCCACGRMPLATIARWQAAACRYRAPGNPAPLHQFRYGRAGSIARGSVALKWMLAHRKKVAGGVGGARFAGGRCSGRGLDGTSRQQDPASPRQTASHLAPKTIEVAKFNRRNRRPVDCQGRRPPYRAGYQQGRVPGISRRHARSPPSCRPRWKLRRCNNRLRYIRRWLLSPWPWTLQHCLAAQADTRP